MCIVRNIFVGKKNQPIKLGCPRERWNELCSEYHNEWIRKSTGMADVIHRVKPLNWRMSRAQYMYVGRWMKHVFDWRPFENTRFPRRANHMIEKNWQKWLKRGGCMDKSSESLSSRIGIEWLTTMSAFGQSTSQELKPNSTQKELNRIFSLRLRFRHQL